MGQATSGIVTFICYYCCGCHNFIVLYICDVYERIFITIGLQQQHLQLPQLYRVLHLRMTTAT